MAATEVITNAKPEEESKRLIALGTLFDYLNRTTDGVNAIRLLVNEALNTEDVELLGPIQALLDHIDSNKMEEASPWQAFTDVPDYSGGFLYPDYRDALQAKKQQLECEPSSSESGD